MYHSLHHANHCSRFQLTKRTLLSINTLLSITVILLTASPVSALTQQERWHYANLGIDFIDSPCTAAAGATAPNGKTIVIDPGHNGIDRNTVNPTTGLRDHDYPNPNENEEVFFAALKIKAQLIKDGYTVILTKGNAIGTNVTSPNDAGVKQGAQIDLGNGGLEARAKVANDANATLAVSIHDDHSQPWGSFAQVYVQRTDLYRTGANGKKTFGAMAGANAAAIATASQAAGDKMSAARIAAEGRTVSSIVTDANFTGRAGLDPGNLPMVMLYAKVPWIYNEVGAAPAGMPMDQTHLDAYIKGMINGIEAAVPMGGTAATPSSSTPTPSTGCACPSSSSTSASPGGATSDGTDSAGNEYRFLVGKGLTPIVAAAITGNAIWESGGNQTTLTEVPGIASLNSIGARGIHQWYAGRADGLVAFAGKRGMPWYGKDAKSGYDLQLDYLWLELTTSHASNLAATKRQPDIASATTTFEATFEVSGATNTYPTRIALAKKVLQKFGGGAGSTGSPSGTTNAACADSSNQTQLTGYQNPLRNLKAGRVDQGVDYSGSGPIYAIGNGTVANITNSGWQPGGTFIAYKLTDGPAKDKYVYVAEQCAPKVAIGDPVGPTTVLCDMSPGDAIEIGWADGSKLGQALAHDVWQHHDSRRFYTAYGKNFSDLLVKLGAPAGTIDQGAQELGAPLPTGWPTW